jgi:hypothetical protein
MILPYRCRTLKGWPAIVSVPVRSAPLSFVATAKVTEPSPLPLVPAVIVIHEALLVAVHAQPPVVDTDTPIPEAPEDNNVTFVGLIV